MDNPKDISVVIGFKDWGLERLALAVRTTLASFGDLDGEVIVSDYGSNDPDATREALVDLGAIYVYTPTDGTWSRSRALNAGFAVATGKVLVSTDADMIFSPQAFSIIGHRILLDPGSALVLQCRDLPPAYSDEDLYARELDWRELENASRLRPRWGMGGMMAVHRSTFLKVRGLDERMHTYGGEDIDFANRIRRAGVKLEWMQDRDVRMYHVWHAPTRQIMNESAAGRAAIEANRRIMLDDKSYMRNIISWRHRPELTQLPVSVVISTYNRADYLGDSINSVLAQTMGEFELIIVDDGSTDNTKQVVDSFEDPRVRYFYQSNQGIAAARNLAATMSNGVFTAVHDDDDIMLPWRLEAQLASIRTGTHGTYGGWIDFDNSSGTTNVLPGKELTLASLLHSGKVYLHPTLMVKTDVMRKVKYDPTLRSGSDYNLGMRLMRSGFKLVHCGRVVTMRRIHSDQITAKDPAVQRTSAILSSFSARAPMSHAEMGALRKMGAEAETISVPESQSVFTSTGAYLPDHLVTREVHVNLTGVQLSEKQRQALSGADSLLHGSRSEGGLNEVWAVYSHATLEDLRLLANEGVVYDLAVEPKAHVDDSVCTGSEISFKALVDHWMLNSGNVPDGQAWVAVECGSPADNLLHRMDNGNLPNIAVIEGHIGGNPYSVSIHGFASPNEAVQGYVELQRECARPIGQWLFLNPLTNLTGTLSPLWNAESEYMEGGL